jgi:hypothetical protein
MRVIVYLPLVVSALPAVAGPWSASRMPPKSATRLLLATGATSALAALALLAALLLATLLAGGLVSVLEAGHDADELFDRAGARGTSSPR